MFKIAFQVFDASGAADVPTGETITLDARCTAEDVLENLGISSSDSDMSVITDTSPPAGITYQILVVASDDPTVRYFALRA